MILPTLHHAVPLSPYHDSWYVTVVPYIKGVQAGQFAWVWSS